MPAKQFMVTYSNLDYAEKTGRLDDIIKSRLHKTLLKTAALQNAIFNNANFSSIATDANDVIKIFNVGTEHKLRYAAPEVMNKITRRFETLVLKTSPRIKAGYELTHIRKNSNRFAAHCPGHDCVNASIDVSARGLIFSSFRFRIYPH